MVATLSEDVWRIVFRWHKRMSIDRQLTRILRRTRYTVSENNVAYLVSGCHRRATMYRVALVTTAGDGRHRVVPPVEVSYAYKVVENGFDDRQVGHVRGTEAWGEVGNRVQVSPNEKRRIESLIY